jgi:hypothetical protein
MLIANASDRPCYLQKMIEIGSDKIFPIQTAREDVSSCGHDEGNGSLFILLVR